MANHKSAAKRARQTVKKAARNNLARKTCRTFERKVRTAITNNDAESAQKFFISFSSKVDKAAQKGYYHAKTAARKIGRLASQINAISK